jgi:hypothetical protein
MKDYSTTEKFLTISFAILAVSMVICAGLAIIQTTF